MTDYTNSLLARMLLMQNKNNDTNAFQWQLNTMVDLARLHNQCTHGYFE